MDDWSGPALKRRPGMTKRAAMLLHGDLVAAFEQRAEELGRSGEEVRTRAGCIYYKLSILIQINGTFLVGQLIDCACLRSRVA